MTPRQHSLPQNLPAQLDLRHAPDGKQRRHYLPLVQLLEALGAALDTGDVDRAWILAWERAVLDHIHDGEIDIFMRPPDAPEFSLADVPRQRWLNLRHVLMRRKGLE